VTTFFVPGTPGPQGSKSFKGFSKQGKAILAESSQKVKPWRTIVARIASGECVPIDGPVVVRLEFVILRPKSTPKTKPTPPAIKQNGDIDKLARSTLDGLTGYAYADDAQVTTLIARKRIAEIDEPTGCMIHVYPEQIREWGTGATGWTITVGEGGTVIDGLISATEAAA
jgi:Holliday junction resolvase RusA-like endonuclease